MHSSIAKPVASVVVVETVAASLVARRFLAQLGNVGDFSTKAATFVVLTVVTRDATAAYATLVRHSATTKTLGSSVIYQCRDSSVVSMLIHLLILSRVRLPI